MPLGLPAVQPVGTRLGSRRGTSFRLAFGFGWSLISFLLFVHGLFNFLLNLGHDSHHVRTEFLEALCPSGEP